MPVARELLLLLAGQQPKALDPERVAVQTAVELALLIGDADGRQLERGAPELEGAGGPRLAHGAADAGVGPQTAAESGGRIRGKERLQEREVEAVGAHRQRDRI